MRGACSSGGKYTRLIGAKGQHDSQAAGGRCRAFSTSCASARGRLLERRLGELRSQITSDSAATAAANESLTRRLRRAEDASTTGKSEVAQAKEATAALATTQSSLRYDNAQLRALADEARNRIEQLQAANETLRSALEKFRKQKVALEESLRIRPGHNRKIKWRIRGVGASSTRERKGLTGG